MNHWARFLSLGPSEPLSLLPVSLLNTVTCSSPDSLVIHSAQPPPEAELVEAGLLLVAVLELPGVIGLSGVTPIWSASHFWTLASAGLAPRGISISWSLLRSVMPPDMPSVAFLKRASMPVSFFSGTFSPLLAWRPPRRSSRRFFFLDLASTGASVSFLFWNPSLSRNEPSAPALSPFLSPSSTGVISRPPRVPEASDMESSVLALAELTSELARNLPLLS